MTHILRLAIGDERKSANLTYLFNPTLQIKPAADPIEEVPTIDTKSVSEDSETSKNDELSTPATLEIEADPEPLIDNAGDKKEDVDPNEAPKEPQTIYIWHFINNMCRK